MLPRDIFHLTILILVLAALLFAAIVLMKTPRSDRDWLPEFSKVARFSETAPGQYTLFNLRMYEFGEDGASSEGWSNIQLDQSNLKAVWYFVEPFPANALFAHSFLSFVFEDGAGEQQVVSISVEARKEKGEDYSPIKGVLRNYELLYVWSTEKDILTRIAVSLDHKLYAYKLDLEPEQSKKIFEYFVGRTNTLADEPRFYNTVHSNCTNELAKAVNEAFPSALPWHRSWVMTGRSAQWLHKLGFIRNGDSKSFEELTEQSNIQGHVKANTDAADFATKWRAAFRNGLEE